MNKVVPLKNWLKYIARSVYPIPKPPNIDSFKNICEVELVPYKDLINFYRSSLKKYLPDRNPITHLEFGVYNGTSLAAAYHFYKQSDLSEFRIIAFDSFQGLPFECESDDGGVWKKGMYRCPRSQTEKCLHSRDVNIDKIEFIEGWYKDTLTSTTYNQLQLERVDVIFIDSDTYSSCQLVLNFIKYLIKSPMLICFDDWKLKNLDLYGMGESRAFSEFLHQEKDLKIEEIISYNRKSKSFMLYKTC